MPRKTSLADDLAEPPRHAKIKDACKLGEAMALRSNADAAAFQAALDNPKWTLAALTRVFEKHDINASMVTVRAHRLGQCACARGAK